MVHPFEQLFHRPEQGVHPLEQILGKAWQAGAACLSPKVLFM